MKKSKNSFMDGFVVDVKVSGTVKLDVTIDNEMFMKLAAPVQKGVLRLCAEQNSVKRKADVL